MDVPILFIRDWLTYTRIAIFRYLDSRTSYERSGLVMERPKVLSIVLVVVLSLASVLLAPVMAEPEPHSSSGLKDYTDMAADEYQWGPVYQVATGTITAPKLLVGPDQDVAVLWASNDQDLHFAHLDKDGNLLSDGTLKGAYAHGNGWDAALDASGLAVVWAEASGRLMFQRFGLDGSAVGVPRAVSVESSGLKDPSIAISSSGTVYISYIASRFSGPMAAVLGLTNDGKTLMFASQLDLDGSGASVADLTMGPSGKPCLLLTTGQGTYLVALDKAGSEEWFFLIYATGQGSNPVISSGNGVIAVAWLPASGASVSVAIFNPEGAKIAKDNVATIPLASGMDAVLDRYGVLQVASGDGISIVHTAIGIGQGVLFHQNVAQNVGPSTAIHLASDDFGTLYVIFIDQGTGLFYAHADTYAFEATVANPKAFDGLHPSKEASGAISIKNMGGIVDVVGLQATIIPSSADWTPKLSSSEIYMQKDSEVLVPFSVVAPAQGSDGASASLYLQVSALSMPSRTVHIEVPLRLTVDYGVSISNSMDVINVPPGLSEDTKVTVKNDGEVQEHIYLGASNYNGPDGGGWHVSLDSYHLTLAPGASQDVNLTVTAPYTAHMGQTTAIDVTAMVEEETASSARATFYAIAQSDIKLTMTLEPNNGQSVLPGETAQYLVKVTNDGRSDGQVAVGLEVVSGFGDWEVYLARDSISLGGGTSVSVPMTVIAPRDAVEGSRFVARVTAKGLQTPVESMLDVTTFVKKVSSVSVRLDNRYAEADPGGAAVYHLTVKNNGNGGETLLLRSVMPFGWVDVDYYVDGQQHTLVSLAVGESTVVEARAKVPLGAASGDNNLTLLVLDGQARELAVTAHVNMVSDLWFSSSQTVQEVVDGQANFDFRIKNYGNGPDVVRFEVHGLSSGWTFPEVLKAGGYLSLNTGKETIISMHVQVPDNLHNDSVPLDVWAIPLHGDAALVRLLLKIVPTDLEITGIDFSVATHVKGNVETVSARVHNNGPGLAGNVMVRAEDNGHLLGEQSLTVLRANDEKSVTFTWAVTEGHHTLKFTVDPEDRIFERDKDNNVAEASVNAVASTVPTNTVPVDAIAGGTIITTVALAGAAVSWSEAGRFKLMWLFWVPLYTKLKRHSILDHFIRGQVYGYIKANPGEHYNAIKKALSLKNGTLVYHLQTLEREEYIKSVSDGRYKRFYPAGMKVPEEPLVRLNKIQEIILRLIGDRPAISQKEIAEEIGLSGATINYHINVMLKAAVIKLEKIGRTTHCYAIDENGDVIEAPCAVEAEPEEGPGPENEPPKGP